jgi:outer membrane protein
MKTINFVITTVLFVAVIVLFILHFSGACKPEKSETASIAVTDTTIKPSYKLAYINVDTLLNNYSFYKELETKLLDRQKSLEAELNRQAAAFEKEAQAFQVKVQNNSFLSQESAQAQEQELMTKQQNLLQRKDELSMQLAKEGQEMEKQLLDTVVNFLKQFNKDKKYRHVFNAAMFLYADEADDITDTVLTCLNLRYKPAKK